VHIRCLNAAVQFAVQAAVFHKPVVGADRHGKTIRHVQPRMGRHFAQIGHLAAHKGDVVQADIAKRHDIGAVLMRLIFKQILHLLTNAVKGLLQRLIAFIGKRVEVAYHLKNRRYGASAHGMHVIHAKGPRSGEVLLHIAHGLKGCLVGRQQAAETRATLPQMGLKSLLTRKLFRVRLIRAIAPQPLSQAVEQRHVT